MANHDIQAEFDAALTLDDKARVLANHILQYRKNVRPRSLQISNCIFNSGFGGQGSTPFTKDEQKILIEKVRGLVSEALSFDYQRLENTNFRTNPENFEELSRKFDRTYLTTKKWQTQPVLFKGNVYNFLNLLPKRPIKFAEANSAVDYEQHEPIKVQKVHDSSYISNSAKFYYNDEFQFLYSTVTSLTFNPINTTEFYGVDPERIGIETFMDETKFEKQVDVCTYIVPNGNPEYAVNIMRYDGTGFNHFNQVFYSDEHKEVFGELAEVPHFHFQNNVENLIYTKKEKNNEADRTYSNAGCNAIDIPHLTNYLKKLDELSYSDLQASTSDFGMPFLQAKKLNIPMAINIKKFIYEYGQVLVNSAALSKDGIKYLTELYEKINSISFTDNKPEPGHFDGLVLSLETLKLINAEREACKDKRLQFEIMALETVCATKIMETISGKSTNLNNPDKSNKN